MLFSDETVSNYINSAFEPAWESVRPVPRVTIDFGNGKVVKRTLHGNVATWVCTPDGQVLDVLPGIYEPVMFVRRLRELTTLAEFAAQQQRTLRDATGSIQEYHDRQAQRLEANEPRDQFVRMGIRTITGVERGVRLTLQPARRIQARGGVRPASAGYVPGRMERLSMFERPAREKLEEWETLATDTHLNETRRRLQIHKHLAKQPLTKPADLTKWLYREVLHADLDDPWLGLGPLLFGDYPFTDDEPQTP